MLLEACVDTLESALRSATEGADRIELCDNLAADGTTPSHGLMVLAMERLEIPVCPMVRPRGGDFVYDADELDVMVADVRHARNLGAAAIVTGALTPDGDVDIAAMSRLRHAADTVPLAFHRAFDQCRDPFAALEELVSLGVVRVLTSGQAATAWEGRALLAKLVRQAAGRIEIMAVGSVYADHAVELIAQTGVSELHARGTVAGRIGAIVDAAK